MELSQYKGRPEIEKQIDSKVHLMQGWGGV